MIVVDTNVLVYAANEDVEQHRPCRARLEALRRDPSGWYLTWPILYEFLRVVTRPRVLQRPLATSEAWSFVAALLTAPGVGLLRETDRHSQVAARTLEEIPAVGGSLLHDAHTAILMREHGVHRILTHDTDFHRFPFLEVVDPLQDAAS